MNQTKNHHHHHQDNMIAAGCNSGEINSSPLSILEIGARYNLKSPLGCGLEVYIIAFKDDIIAAGCSNGVIKLFALAQSGVCNLSLP